MRGHHEPPAGSGPASSLPPRAAARSRIPAIPLPVPGREGAVGGRGAPVVTDLDVEAAGTVAEPDRRGGPRCVADDRGEEERHDQAEIRRPGPRRRERRRERHHSTPTGQRRRNTSAAGPTTSRTQSAAPRCLAGPWWPAAVAAAPASWMTSRTARQSHVTRSWARPASAASGRWAGSLGDPRHSSWSTVPTRFPRRIRRGAALDVRFST